VVAAEEPDVRERIERAVLVARAVGCHLPSPRCGHAPSVQCLRELRSPSFTPRA
jgi:hypothetical protein